MIFKIAKRKSLAISIDSDVQKLNRITLNATAGPVGNKSSECIFRFYTVTVDCIEMHLQ